MPQTLGHQVSYMRTVMSRYPGNAVIDIVEPNEIYNEVNGISWNLDGLIDCRKKTNKNDCDQLVGQR